MGKSTTSRIRRLVGAIAPISLFGLGYIMADTSAVMLPLELMLASKGSAHIYSGKRAGPVAAVTAEARVLFDRPGRGPRADHILTIRRSSAVAKQPSRVMAALAPLDVEITGSNSGTEYRVNRRKKSHSTNLSGAHDGYAAQSQARTSTPFLMASLAGANAYRFTGAAAHAIYRPQAEAQAKISRGLIFQGESEMEYQARQRRCLATAIYFEARGEQIRGQLAVAQVVMNRVRTPAYPDTICGVVFQGQWQRNGCQFSFACDGQADVPRNKELWALANTLAKRVTQGKGWLGEIGYATHYHATYVKPRWRHEMNHIKRIGQHIFYRMPVREVDATATNPAQGPKPARSG